MTVTDNPLKVLIRDFALDFAAWFLDVDIDTVRSIREANVELQPEPVQPTWSDTVFRVGLTDRREVLLHIEFQGPRSHRPMPWRMLDYMSRLAERAQCDLCSVVLYVGEGAGRTDNGQHHVTCPDSPTPSLLWRYRVIRLWELPAEHLLQLERPALLPLIGQTHLEDPERIIPDVVHTIARITNKETQARLFTALVNLMRDEEVIHMTEKLVQTVDRGLLMDTPYLRRIRQEAREEALAESNAEWAAKQTEWSAKQTEWSTKQAEWAAKQQELQTLAQKALKLARKSVLDVLVEQFDPMASDYQRIEAQLETITDPDVLYKLLQQARHAADFAAFEQTLTAQLPETTTSAALD